MKPLSLRERAEKFYITNKAVPYLDDAVAEAKADATRMAFAFARSVLLEAAETVQEVLDAQQPLRQHEWQNATDAIEAAIRKLAE